MKKFKNILLLTFSLTVIVFFWLLPKTRGEKKTEYVRVYTEEKEIAIDEDTAKISVEKKSPAKKIKTKKQRVVVQVDTLYEKVRMKDIKPSIYSRSIHFRPREVLTEAPMVEENDSIFIRAVAADTTVF